MCAVVFALVGWGFPASGGEFQCPGVLLSDAQLSEIVQQARATRSDIPSPFDSYRTGVSRLRCLYLYREAALPENFGSSYLVFVIDPLGEVIEMRTGTN